MKFIGLEPIPEEPQIEIRHNGHVWDLHNAADFTGYEPDPQKNTLKLIWDFGCDCAGVTGGEISLVFHEVIKAMISEPDLSLPRSEDSCLSAIYLKNGTSIKAEFRGGQTFEVVCKYVVFNPGETIGEPET